MFSLSNLKIRTKLWLIISVTALCAFGILFYELIEGKNLLTESKEDDLVHVVEAAESMVQFYHEKVPELGEENARKMALEAIASIRYDEGNGYLWINDFNARMIMHPIKPELNGKDLSRFEDPNGFRVFQAFADGAQNTKGALVPYFWERPGESRPISKTSYVKAFRPWGWVIGTGVYTDDIDKIFWANTRTSLLTFSIVIGLVIILVQLIGNDIRTSLQEMRDKLRLIRNGDLSVTLQSESRLDEFGDLSRSCNKLTASFAKTIDQLQQTASELSVSSKQMESTTNETRTNINHQFLETESLATAMEEMAATVQDVAENANKTSSATLQAHEKACNGKKLMLQSCELVQQLADQIRSSESTMSSLEDHTGQITQILSVIRGISEQTNLLALNAAIEAARAGESGRGFAVVADEVRSLAQKTQQSTEQIQATTEQLQHGSHEAVNVMRKCLEISEQSLSQSEETSESLNQIANQVDLINDMNIQIAAAAEEQSNVAEEVSSNVLKIRDISSEVLNDSGSIAAVGSQLASLADGLQASTKQFTVARHT